MASNELRPEDQEIRPDGAIANDIQDSLQWDSRIDATHITVAVENGEVTLTGLVRFYSHKVAASEDAWRIKGVRSVHNHLAVSPSTARTDGDIVADVVNALGWDSRVDPRGIVVGAAGGVVTLSGTVGSLSEQRAALEDAWHTPGVVDVNDQLEVSPTRRRPDFEIATAVRAAITRDARIADPTRISVQVTDGVVRLRGGVTTAAERRAADEDARFTASVVDVHNELTIAA